jgi:putative tryptophan/tyrosine transport system substrate-binding protein
MIGRRDFITLVGGTAAWPRAVRAQEGERMRRVGVLTSGAGSDDPDGQTRSAAFIQGLRLLGWADGRNIRLDYRWGAGDADNMRKYAAELVGRDL